MVIISKTFINEFISINPKSRDALIEWYIKTKGADWANFSEIKNTFNSVDVVGNDLYVFNIKGNQYRLIVRIFLKVRTVYIKFIGTHKEYDKINILDL